MKFVAGLIFFMLFLSIINSSCSVLCKVGTQFNMTTPNGPIHSAFSTIYCPGVNTRCLRADVRVSTVTFTWNYGSRSYYNQTVDYAIGMCQPRFFCTYSTCEAFNGFLGTTFTSAYTIDSCNTACCNTDNCNENTAKEIGPNANPAAIMFEADGTSSATNKMALNFAGFTANTLIGVAVILWIK